MKHLASCGMVLFAVMVAAPYEGQAASPAPCSLATLTPDRPTGISDRVGFWRTGTRSKS